MSDNVPALAVGDGGTGSVPFGDWTTQRSFLQFSTGVAAFLSCQAGGIFSKLCGTQI